MGPIYLFCMSLLYMDNCHKYYIYYQEDITIKIFGFATLQIRSQPWEMAYSIKAIPLGHSWWNEKIDLQRLFSDFLMYTLSYTYTHMHTRRKESQKTKNKFNKNLN